MSQPAEAGRDDLRRVIIVGGSGSIGRAILREGAQVGMNIVATANRQAGEGMLKYDMGRSDITDVIPDIGAGDVLVLLAGYGSPSWIYEHQDDARKLNTDATKAVIERCTERGTDILFMSTDQVFDGLTGGYSETDAKRPLNLYGRMKADIEDFLLRRPGRHCVMRTGWNVPVEHDARCVVQEAYARLREGNARMAADNEINVSDIRDTARAVVSLCHRTDRPPVIHLAACPPVDRARMCDWIIGESRFGTTMRVEKIRHSQLTYTEPRPLKAWLDNTMAVDQFGFAFSSPEDTVRNKVRILDKHHATG